MRGGEGGGLVACLCGCGDCGQDIGPELDHDRRHLNARVRGSGVREAARKAFEILEGHTPRKAVRSAKRATRASMMRLD